MGANVYDILRKDKLVLTVNSVLSSNVNLRLKDSGEITGSQVLFSGGKIGGFNIESNKIINAEETVELSSVTHGLNVKDNLGVERVSIKSGSFQTIGGGTQYIENKSFEDQTVAAGRNRRSGSNITSWSFSTTGGAFIALTDRSGYVSDDDAVSGDITLDDMKEEINIKTRQLGRRQLKWFNKENKSRTCYKERRS